MRTAIAAKLCLGLLLLTLLLPSQIYSQNTTITPSTSNNTSVSTTVLPTTKQTQNTNTTTTGSGNSLQSTAGLFIFSFSLLHLYC